jgi:hypothetical protein
VGIYMIHFTFNSSRHCCERSEEMSEKMEGGKESEELVDKKTGENHKIQTEDI